MVYGGVLLKDAATPKVHIFVPDYASPFQHGKTGLTGGSVPNVYMSKDGGAWTSIKSDTTWAELGEGWYSLTLGSTSSVKHTSVAGKLTIHITSGDYVADTLFDVSVVDHSNATNIGVADLTTIKGYVDLIDDGTNGLAAIKTSAAAAASDAATNKTELQSATYGLSVLKSFQENAGRQIFDGRYIRKSSSNTIVTFFAAKADGTAVTGLSSFTVTRSKNGGAWGAITGTVAELSGGWYNITLSTTDTNTDGTLYLKIVHGSMKTIEGLVGYVHAIDMSNATSLGITNLGTNTTSIYNIVNNVTYGNSALQVAVNNNYKELTSVTYGLSAIKTDTSATKPVADNIYGDTQRIYTDTNVTIPGKLVTIEGKVDTIDINLDSTLVKADTIDSKINAFRFVDMRSYTDAIGYMLSRFAEAITRLKNGS